MDLGVFLEPHKLPWTNPVTLMRATAVNPVGPRPATLVTLVACRVGKVRWAPSQTCSRRTAVSERAIFVPPDSPLTQQQVSSVKHLESIFLTQCRRVFGIEAFGN